MDLRDKTEKLAMKAEMLHSGMKAMEVAIFNKTCTPESYRMGYCLLVNYAKGIQDEMMEIVEKLYRREAV